MGKRAIRKEVDRILLCLARLRAVFPGAQELWYLMNGHYGERDLTRVAHYYYPVIRVAMMRDKRYGQGPYRHEQVLEFLEDLRSGPRPPVTLGLNFPFPVLPSEVRVDAGSDKAAQLLADETAMDERGNGEPEEVPVFGPPSEMAEPAPGRDSGNHRQIIMESDSRSDWDRTLVEEEGELVEILKYRGNEGLRVARELGGVNTDAEAVDEEWATGHEDPEAKLVRLRIYFRDCQVDEVILVSVDGGRARLPRPKNTHGAREVDPFEYKVAEIVSYGDELVEYMNRSGLRIP